MAPAPWHFNPGSARLGTAKRFVPPNFPAPGVSNTTTYGTGVGGDKAATSVIVEGTMKGEGKVEIQLFAARRCPPGRGGTSDGWSDQHQRPRLNRQIITGRGGAFDWV